MTDETYEYLHEPPPLPRMEITEPDRILLKLAAHALGATGFEELDGEGLANLHFPDGSSIFGWNPLLFSDDAFDLQVSLDVYVFQSLDAHETQSAGPGQRVIYQPWGDDKAAATRRAATRAAAEIGKQHSLAKVIDSKKT